MLQKINYINKKQTNKEYGKKKEKGMWQKKNQKQKLIHTFFLSVLA